MRFPAIGFCSLPATVRALSVCLVIMFSTTLAGQNTTDRADSIISSTIEASGGIDLIRALRGYVGRGTITFVESERRQSGTVTIKVLFGHATRLEASFTSGNLVWVVRGAWGRTIVGNSKPVEIPVELAMNLDAFALPVASFVKAHRSISTSSTELLDSGRVVNVVSRPSTHARNGTRHTIHYHIDSKSGLIARTVSEVYSLNRKLGKSQHQFIYSDYRSVDGVMFPFEIQERIGGKTIAVIRLETVQTNHDFSDSEFVIE